jgi:hypothetical protein
MPLLNRTVGVATQMSAPLPSGGDVDPDDIPF